MSPPLVGCQTLDQYKQGSYHLQLLQGGLWYLLSGCGQGPGLALCTIFLGYLFIMKLLQDL